MTSAPSTLPSLHGKVALITGGSGALGSEFAKGFARAGASVVLLARDTGRLTATADRLTAETGRPLRWVAGELRDRGAVEGLVAEAWDCFGQIDVVVNSAVPAGCQVPLGDLMSTPDEAWHDVFDPIVFGALVLGKALAPRMRENGGGAFVNISSPTGVTPYPGMDAYGLAKGSLLILTKYMAREWGAWGIRANALTPGLIVDNNNLRADAVHTSPALRALLDRTSLGRAGSSDELVAAAAFLASDAASFISGAVLPVDGGRF